MVSRKDVVRAHTGGPHPAVVLRVWGTRVVIVGGTSHLSERFAHETVEAGSADAIAMALTNTTHFHATGLYIVSDDTLRPWPSAHTRPGRCRDTFLIKLEALVAGELAALEKSVRPSGT